MNTLTEQLITVPEILRNRVLSYWQAYKENLQVNQQAPLQHKEFLDRVGKIWAVSDFVADNCVRYPALIAELFNSGDILRNYRKGEYLDKLNAQLKHASEMTSLMQKLRQFRRREILRIIWRDLAQWTDLDKTVKELSALADACIDRAVALLYQWQCVRYGTPQNYQGQPQTLLVVALGKLGGCELNLSSDVDLMFVYPQNGETQGNNDAISHEVFFRRLGQDLIQVLNKVTADGFVFRVDMRLRPFGTSGPLALHFAGLKNYYREQGRDWERYAMMKARLIGQHPPAIVGELMMIVGRFVYRHYVDYRALEALRQMHDTVVEESKDKRIGMNIKLGPGGIREIEFIGQAYQFIWGGENLWLQERRILRVLALLGGTKLAKKQTDLLTQAYIFLRNVEHRLQAVSDRQTHDLPDSDYEKQRLAFSMHFSSWSLFIKQLDAYRNKVHEYFEGLVARPQHEAPKQQAKLYNEATLLWWGEQGEKYDLSTLNEMGFKDCEKILASLNTLRNSRRYHKMNELGHKRFSALMPILLMTIGKTDNPEITLQRLLSLLEVMMRRSAYMVLLLENPKALEQLVKLCAVSPWIAEQLARYPLLLGELLDTQRLYAPLDLVALQSNIERALSSISSAELDEQMEALRNFKLHSTFRVAAMDVTGVLPLMRVSDHLSNIAQVVLQQVQSLAWHYLVTQHGYPQGCEKDSKFAIIAYGKLGGIELGYGSDLDLVFIFDNDPHGITQAKEKQESIANSTFYIRLAQRILHILNARTDSGVLFEVDTRLRPSGESGLLATGLETFAAYQQQEAWTWEHQALVRARVISGSDYMLERFNTIRHQVLGMKRNPTMLVREVCDMRQRMRKAAKPAAKDMFDLKQGQGGITDIEFIVQYAVLRWAFKHPALRIYSDNIRILEALGTENLLSMADVRVLSDAYRAYRAVVHLLDLQNQPSFIPDNELCSYREGVKQIWQRLMKAN